MYDFDFLQEVKNIISAFPGVRSGLGRSPKNRELFENLIRNSKYNHLLKYDIFDIYHLICHNMVDFPACQNSDCTNVNRKRDNSPYCCMACYKGDPATVIKLSEAKFKLYADSNWKAATEHKRKATNISKFGCEHPMQNPEIFAKHEKASYQAKTYMGMAGIRGYEPQVIDYFLSLGFKPNKDIINGSTALTIQEWKLIGTSGNYQIPDFYLPGYATFVEVKSDYTLEKDHNKIIELLDIFEPLGLDYLVILVQGSTLYEYDLISKTKKLLNLENISKIK